MQAQIYIVYNVCNYIYLKPILIWAFLDYISIKAKNCN